MVLHGIMGSSSIQFTHLEIVEFKKPSCICMPIVYGVILLGPIIYTLHVFSGLPIEVFYP